MDIEGDEQAGGDAQGEATYFYGGVHFLAAQLADGDAEVVSKHKRFAIKKVPCFHGTGNQRYEMSF
jgi:hypothetical protein